MEDSQRQYNLLYIKMSQKHLKEENQLHFVDLTQDSSPNIYETDSQTYTLYEEIMLEQVRDMGDCKIQETFGLLFQQHQIVYCSDRKASHIKASIATASNSSQVIVLNIHWGSFNLYLRILNVNTQSSHHHLSGKHGSYGHAFEIKNGSVEFIIKCIKFGSFKNEDEAKAMAIKEFTILKIASVLRVGPKISNYQGFDLIIYKNCIEFAQQKCIKFSNLKKYEIKSLKDSLYLLHRMNIFHFDIKPDNIMLSDSFSKPVFIDFGLSQVILVERGKKMLFSYRGTFDFCSTEMMLAFQSSTKQFVDLFYNDAFALKSSIDFICSSKQSTELQLNQMNFYDHHEESEVEQSSLTGQKEGQIIQNKVNVFIIKNLLFVGQIQKVKLILSKCTEIQQKNILSVICHFLYELRLTKELKAFNRTKLKNYHVHDNHYAQFNREYSQNSLKLKENCWNPQKSMIITQKYERLLFMINEKSYFHYHKASILRYLVEGQKLSRNMTIKLYLQLINFSNNLHFVDMDVRVRITKLLILRQVIMLKLDELSHTITDYDFMKRSIRQLMIEQIQNIQYKAQIQINSNDLDIQKENMIELVEHVFILQLGTAQEIIYWLNSMLNGSFFTYEEKIELTLKAKHSSLWLQYRLRTQYGSENVHQTDGKILSWCRKQFGWLAQQKNELNWMAAQLKKNCQPVDKQYQYSGMRTYKNFIKKSLLISYELDALFFSMEDNKIESIQSFLEKAYYLLPRCQHQKFHFFLFRICIDGLNIGGNFKNSHQICRNLLFNTRCQQLYTNNMITFYMRCHQQTLRKAQVEYFQGLFNFFVHINIYTIFTYHSLVLFALNIVKAIKQKNQLNPVSLNERQKTQFGEILNRLKKLVDSLDIYKMLAQYFSSYQRQHECISYQLISDIFAIKIFVKDILSENWQERAPQNLPQMLQCINCPKCHETITIYHYLENQSQLINMQPEIQDKVNLQKQFITRYNEISQLVIRIADKERSEFYEQLNLLSLQEFCALDRIYQIKYHGILMMYCSFKKRNLIQYYMENSQQNFRLIVITMEVLTQHSLEELAIFLNTLTNIITVSYSQIFYELIFSAFNGFIGQLGNRINFPLLINLLESIEVEKGHRNIYNIIYYYVSLFYVTSELSHKLMIKIVKVINDLPSFSALFFETHVIRFKMIENANKNEIQKRKLLYLKKRMTVLFKIQGKRTISSRNKIKRSNKMEILMDEKCMNLGGSYDLQSENLPLLYVKINKVEKRRILSSN